MALTMQLLALGLLPWAFLLPPGGWAGEIIGGREAEPHSRPYMAYLKIREEKKTYRCGGFLVAENFVLTAAHCQGDSITVTLGAHNIDKRERSQQVIEVHQQIPHPQYDNQPHNNDIMILQLKTAAKLNAWVGTVELPLPTDSVQPYTMCGVAGWGRTSTESPSLPATLREVEVEVMPDDACPKTPVWLYGRYNPKTMMCVGNPSFCRDSAKGDSGGPLVCDDKAQGIVSWGPCRAPGVYTRVAPFVSWIKNIMKVARDRARL